MAGREIRVGLAPVLIACAWALLGAGAAEAEAATHVFDPVLSLTGSCAVSEQDPVPDPAEPPCPSEEGAHPKAPFDEPHSVTTDNYGNIYVPNNSEGQGIVDVFDSGGFLIAEIAGKDLEGIFLQDIAVDGEGHLYLYGSAPEAVVLRLDPDTGYDPANGKIAYKQPVTVLTEADGLSAQANSIALDSSGHLYVAMEPVFNSHINEYSSATEGNELIDSTIGEGILKRSKWVTIDSRNGDIYASHRPEGQPAAIKVLSGEPGHPLKRTISGFSTAIEITSAVDETSGYVLVADLDVRKRVYVFPPSEEDQTTSEAIAEIQHEFKLPSLAPRIAVDNGSSSPNAGYLFVPSLAKAPPDHIYAFKPIPALCEPKIESLSVSEVTETEADAEAVVNPCNAVTTYRVEYVTQEAFEAGGWEGAPIAAEGEIPAGGVGVPVSATIFGLAPETAYRIRVFADNCDPEEPERPCTNEGEVTFTTYPVVLPLPPCPNDAPRAGPSAHLPDCRAYELVTPSDTGGRPPQTVGISTLGLFATPSASPGGDSASFIVRAGGIPGLGGAGGFLGDGYVAERQAEGWQTELKGPSGAQIGQPGPGGLSPDHGFAAWSTGDFEIGELHINGGDQYILYPDGSFHLAGRGSLGTSPQADLKRISDAGGHIVFSTLDQLEPQAPPSGTRAVYDRTIDPLSGEEETHVVSLLPEDLTPEEGEDATYLGSSADGSAFAFKLGNTAASPLYLRLGDIETLVASEEAGSGFAGLSEEGRYLFYVLGGDLYRFDTQAEEEATVRITETGDALFANVSAEGSRVYFVSESVLSGEEENSHGDKAQVGEQNLYLWDGEDIGFVATVNDRDVEGELIEGGVNIDGLGLWTAAANSGRVAIDPSRTSADGSVLLFKSRASLTDYDSKGTAQVYRFDATTGELACLSCSPTASPPTADATLYTVGQTYEDAPVKTYVWIPNLSPDGGRAFFESPDPLVLRDTDETQDVYEWEEQGVGSCEEEGGCVYLISSGQSARPNYLYGASESGDDVFFISSDLLVGADDDETPSIYDARVGGGFAEAEPPLCPSECQGQRTAAPSLPFPTSPVLPESGNVQMKKCPKGKRRVRIKRSVRCVKPHKPKRGSRRSKRHHSSGGVSK